MTQALEYKATFLQKLLGRNYKWWYLMKYSFKATNSRILGNVISVLAIVINTSAILYIWNYTNASTAVFTYLLVGRIYESLAQNYFYPSYADSIHSGSITSTLMLPQDIFFINLFRMIGTRFAKNFVAVLGSVLALIFCVIFFAKIQFTSPVYIFIIVINLPITFLLKQLFGSILGSLAFWINDKRDFEGVKITYESLANIFIGSLIPLDKLPFSTFFTILPFSWIIHHPMQIYLGKYSNLEIFYTFLGGIAWCVVLYFLAKFVFKMGLKRNESVGL